MKTLVIDIETAPNLAHVWSLWKADVGLNQLIVPGYILCFAAKWVGRRDITFERVTHSPTTGKPTPSSQRAMLERAHELLSDADAVVHYNGASFDVPKLNAGFLQHGFAPPAPYAQIDLYRALKKRTSFSSHKLAHIAPQLGIGGKVKHEGHKLWKDCMDDDASAWRRMQSYNEGDVRLTERLYKRVLPWIPQHPNRAIFVDDEAPRCPHCASTRLQRRGVARTHAQVYPRYQCAACGAWSRGKGKLRAPVRRGSVG